MASAPAKKALQNLGTSSNTVRNHHLSLVARLVTGLRAIGVVRAAVELCGVGCRDPRPLVQPSRGGPISVAMPPHQPHGVLLRAQPVSCPSREQVRPRTWLYEPLEGRSLRGLEVAADVNPGTCPAAGSPTRLHVVSAAESQRPEKASLQPSGDVLLTVGRGSSIAKNPSSPRFLPLATRSPHCCAIFLVSTFPCPPTSGYSSGYPFWN